jgi:hypothetical protein
MSATNIHDVIVGVYEDGKETREIAEAAFDAASDETNRELAIRGWGGEILKHEASLWKPETRSGHNNGSGRYAESAARPDQNLFALPVKSNDGSTYHLGELTAELCAKLKGEFAQRRQAAGEGEAFYGLLAKELAAASVTTVAELGEERVAQIRTKAGYRE